MDSNKPAYRILFDDDVYRKDFRRIDRAGQKRILDIIQKKLAIAPEEFGEPLRKELFGYRKLKIGEYRVIYRIRRGGLVVVIVKVGLRRNAEAYRELTERLKRET